MAGRMVPEGGWQNRLKPFKTPRVEVVSHRRFVKALPCICCLVSGLVVQADDPMHIRESSAFHGKDETGGGRTADDRWILPGCRPHHDEQHATGDEGAFWARFGIDQFLLALVLWGLTGDEHAAVQVLRAHAFGRRLEGVDLVEHRRAGDSG